MTHFFYWDDWNLPHIAKHYVEAHEAQHVVRRAKRPYPRSLGNGKYQVKGRTIGGRWLHVIYVFRKAQDIDFSILTPVEQIELMDTDAITYIIHARDLRDGE